jgi:peptide/nickel transport system substrate-binding protein
MTHFLYPGVDGYAQAGGAAGPRFDYNRHLAGDKAVPRKYMRRAGYPSGQYTGNATVRVVGGNGAAAPAIVAIVDRALTSLGFKTHVALVGQGVMYSKYCGVRAREVDVCPTVGWIRDFADRLSVLLIPFYGPAIIPTNNSNWVR